jgi:hypothetical protein
VARCPSGGGRLTRPPGNGRRSGESRVHREWAVATAVVCGEVAELDPGHGREGDVV